MTNLAFDNPYTLETLIPRKNLDAFQTAFLDTFGNRNLQAILPLIGGSASKTYKVILDDVMLAVRVMDLDEILCNRQNQVKCLQIAAAMEIAPYCYYANADTGIVISQYIHSQPVYIADNWLEEIALKLQRLHAYDLFPVPHQTLFLYMAELIKTIRDLELTPLLIDYLAQFEEVMQILSPHLTLASCHNDLNFKNILFNTKTYFIDWEAAGREDPFFDLATFCNEFVLTQAQENYFLNRYFGQTMTAYQQAKIFYMKQVSHGYLGLHFLLHAASGGLALSQEYAYSEVPTLRQWTEGYKLGIYHQNNPKDFLLYAYVQIKESLNQMNTKQFKFFKSILT